MLFVSGLMGPYMAPIPANASAAMLFSFFVAMVIAPWLMLRLHPEGQRGPRTRGGARRGHSSAGSIAASPRRSCARADRPGASSSRSASRRCSSASCSPPRTSRSSCCRSTTSPNWRWWSTCPKAPRSRTPSARCSRSPAWRGNCRKSARSRPMPARRRRSISTGWCATITSRELPELGELHLNLAPQGRAQPRAATPSRSICARG